MDSKYIFERVDKLREDSLMAMGTLSYKLKSDIQKIITDKKVEKKDVTDAFKEIGDELKGKIARLATIGVKIRRLEESVNEKKQIEMRDLELQTELFEIATEMGEDVHKELAETVQAYEKKLNENNKPQIMEDKKFFEMIENILRGIEKMITNIDDFFDEYLENKKNFGGSRQFFIG